MSKKGRTQYPGPENTNSYRIRDKLTYKVLFNLKELLILKILILRKRNGLNDGCQGVGEWRQG